MDQAVDATGGAIKKTANFLFNRKTLLFVAAMAITGGTAAVMDPTSVPIDLSGLITTPVDAAVNADPSFISTAGAYAGKGALAIAGNAANGVAFGVENLVEWGAEALAPGQ